MELFGIIFMLSAVLSFVVLIATVLLFVFISKRLNSSSEESRRKANIGIYICSGLIACILLFLIIPFAVNCML